MDRNAQAVGQRLATISTLRQVLGVDPTTIDWMYAAARTRAYGRGGVGNGSTIVNAPQMIATFGTLNPDDNYLLILNGAVIAGYGGGSRWWTDPAIGVSFLNDVLYVKTFITNARYDTVVWSPAISPALAAYTSLVASSIFDVAPRPGIDRPGWIRVTYLPSVADPASREIRFPPYALAGHPVSIRQPAELIADVTQWYGATLPTSSALPTETVSSGYASIRQTLPAPAAVRPILKD
jgi:hypothetical protein